MLEGLCLYTKAAKLSERSTFHRDSDKVSVHHLKLYFLICAIQYFLHFFQGKVLRGMRGWNRGPGRGKDESGRREGVRGEVEYRKWGWREEGGREREGGKKEGGRERGREGGREVERERMRKGKE